MELRHKSHRRPSSVDAVPLRGLARFALVFGNRGVWQARGLGGGRAFKLTIESHHMRSINE